MSTQPQQPSPIAQLRDTLRRSWPVIAMVLLQVALAAGSIHLMSALRALVYGESQWSKGQKDAVRYLSLYADSGRADHLARFEQALSVPLADRLARQLALSDPADDVAAHAAAVRGGNHPHDASDLIFLIRHLQHSALLREPIALWKLGDIYLLQLQDLALEMRAHLASEGLPDAALRQQWQQRIQAIDEAATPASIDFGLELGNVTRQISRLLLAVNLCTAGLLIVWTLWITRQLQAQRRRMENALQGERENARSTLAAIGDAVVTTRVDGRVAYMNPAAEAMLGVSLQHAHQRPAQDLMRFSASAAAYPFAPLLELALHQGGPLHEGDTMLAVQRADGSTLPVTVVGSPLHEQGEVSGAVFVLRDMQREQEYLEQLSWQATHDPLTGLVNRREFERRLHALLAQPLPAGEADGPQPTRGSLLYVDLDQFKLINDSCGHPAGDAMLQAVCQLLQNGLRAEDTLARLGGDEFGVILAGCPPDKALQVATEMRQGAESLHIRWGERVLRTGVSIGLVHLTPTLDSLQEVLRVADIACYGAKERGRNTVHVHQPQSSAPPTGASDIDWMQRLRDALDRGLFSLYAQEIHPLQRESSGLHLEVLLRLEDGTPEGNAPAEFIPAAERFGLMPAIDRWVVSRALAELARRRANSIGPSIERCAINLSGTSLGDDGLLAFLRGQIALHAVPPGVLCFEITETAAIGRMSNAIRLIGELRQLGCRFSLDDFGAGMSSFTYLRQLPVDYLKIDGSLVRSMAQDDAHRAMVQMVHHIAHVMGKETIAEYAETPATVQALREMGVDHAQGTAIGPPAPFAAAQPTSKPLPSAAAAQRFAGGGFSA